LDNNLANLEGEARDLQGRINNLRGHQALETLNVSFELLSMALPITKLLQARRVIRAFLSRINRRFDRNIFADILIFVGEAIGAIQVINSLRSIYEAGIEIGYLVTTRRRIRSELEMIQQTTQSLSNKFENNNCRFTVTPVA